MHFHTEFMHSHIHTHIYIYIVLASNTISKLRDGELHACHEIFALASSSYVVILSDNLSADILFVLLSEVMCHTDNCL